MSLSKLFEQPSTVPTKLNLTQFVQLTLLNPGNRLGKMVSRKTREAREEAARGHVNGPVNHKLSRIHRNPFLTTFLTPLE